MDVGRLHTVVVFENRASPHIGGELIFRHADFLALKISGLLDPVGPYINGCVSERTRDESRYSHVGTLALSRLDGKTRHRQFADIEFRMAEGAEENFLRIECHEYRIDAVYLYEPIAQRASAVIVADGNGKIEFGHGKPGWTSKLPECHRRNDAGALLHATALYRLIIRCYVDRLRMAGDLHRSATVLHAGLRIPEDLLGLLPVVVVEATLVRHPHAAPS